MARKLTILAVTLAALLFGAVPASAHHRDSLLAPPGVCEGGTSDVSVHLRCYHNWARLAYGRQASAIDGRLDLTAADKNNLILFCHDFSHTACGYPWDYSIKKAGPSGWWAENLAWTNSFNAYVDGGWARSIMSAWLHSDGHFNDLIAVRARYAGCSALLTSDWPSAGPNIIATCHFAENL